jgi:hypothetical protein
VTRKVSYGSERQERPHKVLEDRKVLIRFWVTGKAS